MMRMPGPSQVSRARASSALTKEEDVVAVGVNKRSETTITRRPRGTSMEVAPGSGVNDSGATPGTIPPVSTLPGDCVVAVTDPPS